MDANLKQFYKLDPGFAQFVDRHGLVAADPKVRRYYDLWLLDQALWAEELEEMRANYEAIGKAKRDIEITLKAFRRTTSDADWLNTTKTLREFDIQEDAIESACAKVKAERDKPATKKVKEKKRLSEKS
jgi:hypothetical protein